jgi:hypothetical protein
MTGAKFIAEVSEAELAARILEAIFGVTRPTGFTSEEALDALEADDRAAARRAACAAIEYWQECLEKKQRVS